MRRGLLGLVGGTIQSIARTRCQRRPIVIEPEIPTLRKHLKGQKLRQIDRLGKRLVLVIDNGYRLVIEPRMTGLVLVTDPPTQEHLRLELAVSGVSVDRLLFWDRRGLGQVHGFTEEAFRAAFENGRLGPDALAVDLAKLKQIFGRTSQPIKVALLDQKKIAGIGNLYASEILHRAKIHPEQASNSIKPRSWKRLHESMILILNDAITYEGSTLNDGTYRNSLNETGQYQNQHRVYAKHDQLCSGCLKSKIERIVQAQRSTFFCPRCQKLSK